MTTPTGFLQSLTTALKRLARKGDVEGLRAYVRSEAFLRAFNGLDPRRRSTAMRSYAKAEAFCEAKTRHPLVKPGPIDAPRTQKANWSDPTKLARLAEAYAYAVTGGDDEKAARILRFGPACEEAAFGCFNRWALPESSVAGRRRPTALGVSWNRQRHGLQGGFARSSNVDCRRRTSSDS